MQMVPMSLSISSSQGLMEGKLADSGSAKLHAMRRLRERLRRPHDGITRLVRDGLRFDIFVAPAAAMPRSLCMSLSVGSIRRRNSLEVIIEDWCIGCGLCAQNCPTAISICIRSKVMVDDPNEPAQKAVIKQKATSCDCART